MTRIINLFNLLRTINIHISRLQYFLNLYLVILKLIYLVKKESYQNFIKFCGTIEDLDLDLKFYLKFIYIPFKNYLFKK